MLKRSLLMGALLLGFSLFWAGGARANTIVESNTFSLTDCGAGGSGCPDATYSFDIGTSQATLSIEITGGLTSNNNLIQSVNLGFAPSNVTTLVSPYLTTTNLVAPTYWTSTTSSVSNSGCGTNGGGFVCAQTTYDGGTGVGSPLTSGQTYKWTWYYQPISAGDISSSVHVGANYNPHNGLIVSVADPVPEPSTMSLLLLGLFGLGFAATARRRFAPSQT